MNKNQKPSQNLPFEIEIHSKRGRKKNKHNVLLLEARKHVRLSVRLDGIHTIIMEWDNEQNNYKADIAGVVFYTDYDVLFDFDYQVEKIITKPKKHDRIEVRKSRSGLPKKYNK